MKRQFIKHQHTLLASAIFPALLLALPVNTMASDMRGAILANPCAGCHGTNGASPGSIPAIDDMSAEDIKEELMEFKTDEHKGTIMNRIAKGYTDAEIDLIARYFGSMHK